MWRVENVESWKCGELKMRSVKKNTKLKTFKYNYLFPLVIIFKIVMYINNQKVHLKKASKNGQLKY